LLPGRGNETGVLSKLLSGVRAGQGASLVLRGEAGIGKTALIDAVVADTPNVRVLRAIGVESETELGFGAMHQLCGPVLDLLPRLPGPQADALSIVFGLSMGPAPDRLLVSLAVLSLLAELSAERPVVCVADDAHWMDRESAQALGFAARRLSADPVFVVFAVREPVSALSGIPELVMGGLRRRDARMLLDSVVPWPLDDGVRERVVAETRGNPLALLELPRGLTPAAMAGGFGLTGALPRAEGTEDGTQEVVRYRIEGLPAEVRLLLAAVWTRRRSPKPSSGACSRSTAGWYSTTLWPGRPPTVRPRRRIDGESTKPWRRRPTPTSIRIVGRGIGHGPPRTPLRRSPWN
jgi:hypothetical protein